MKRSFVFKYAKGFWGRGKNNYRITANRVDRALQFAYRDRRTKKRNVRSAWIQQINAATRQFGVPYSQFVNGLAVANIALDRKMLATLAVTEPLSFSALTEHVKAAAPAIPWRDVNAGRITAKHYQKYAPVELPPEFQEAASLEKSGFGLVHQTFVKAEKKAEKVNADLIKAGKVVLKKHVPRKHEKGPSAPRGAPPSPAPGPGPGPGPGKPKQSKAA